MNKQHKMKISVQIQHDIVSGDMSNRNWSTTFLFVVLAFLLYLILMWQLNLKYI